MDWKRCSCIYTIDFYVYGSSFFKEKRLKGSTLIFMVFSWMIVVSFAVFCFTVIFREGKRKVAILKPKEVPLEEEEVT